MESKHDGAKSPAEDKVVQVIRTFEHGIVLALMGLLMVIVTLTTIDLAWLLVRDLRSIREMLLDVEEMLELFGFFLLVLVGMELLSTLKSYMYERVIHVEVVLEVALIALAQKVIILDTSRASGATMLGLSGLILALAAAFWGVRTARRGASAPTR